MSSSVSRPRAQPRAIVRVSDWPSPIAGAGAPAPGNGSIDDPANVPQETQSGGVASGRQTAPPDGRQRRPEAGEGEVGAGDTRGTREHGALALRIGDAAGEGERRLRDSRLVVGDQLRAGEVVLTLAVSLQLDEGGVRRERRCAHLADQQAVMRLGGRSDHRQRGRSHERCGEPPAQGRTTLNVYAAAVASLLAKGSIART